MPLVLLRSVFNTGLFRVSQSWKYCPLEEFLVRWGAMGKKRGGGAILKLLAVINSYFLF